MRPIPDPQPAPAGETRPFVLQEQFTGPVAARDERPAAEVLAERQAEVPAAAACPPFVP